MPPYNNNMSIAEKPKQNQESQPPKFKFTEQHLDMFLEMIKEKPDIVKELLISAQEGNPDDIDFLFELQMRRKITLSFSDDAPTSSQK